MSHNMTSITDLQPIVVKLMEDRGWHCMAEAIRDVGAHIIPERAVRFYHATMTKSPNRPLDEKIRYGTRRGVYLVLQAMVKRGMVECKDRDVDPDAREYRLIRDFAELPKRKPAVRRAVPAPSLPVPSSPPDSMEARPDPADSGADAFFSFLDEMQKMFFERFPKTKDRDDFKFYFRQLKRIVSVNFSEDVPKARKASKKSEPEVLTEPEKPVEAEAPTKPEAPPAEAPMVLVKE